MINKCCAVNYRSNTLVYTPSSCLHNIHILAVAATKRKNFEHMFVLIQVYTAYREQMRTTKLLHKYFSINTAKHFQTYIIF